VLRLQDLVLYGIIVIQPVAPMSVFGVLSERGQGHVVTALLFAMVAMLLTGLSYGRMASAYPNAGSAFTYVAREIHPGLGWLTGWGMVMDYVFNPLICTIWCSQQAHAFLPVIPLWAWKGIFATTFTLLNLRGVRTSARLNTILAAGMGLVVVVILGAGVAYLARTGPHPAGFLTRPFYDPATFRLDAVFGCTSIAVLTYIGFDGISTLSEEVENPRRNVLLATVLTCFVIGLLAAVEVYLAQLIWPASEPFPNVDTAYVAVAGRAWAPLLGVVGLTLLVANLGSGLGAHLGAARLLYGMGRSGALPHRFFGEVHPASGVPHWNVLLVGALVLTGSHLVSFGTGAELLNFGALLAFMGVNAAAFTRFYVRASRRRLRDALAPLGGFLICLGLWLNLGPAAILGGAGWMTAGLLYGAWRTRGFTRPLQFDEPDPSASGAKSPVVG
jgi:amino acid transporter